MGLRIVILPLQRSGNLSTRQRVQGTQQGPVIRSRNRLYDWSISRRTLRQLIFGSVTLSLTNRELVSVYQFQNRAPAEVSESPRWDRRGGPKLNRQLRRRVEGSGTSVRRPEGELRDAESSDCAKQSGEVGFRSAEAPTVKFEEKRCRLRSQGYISSSPAIRRLPTESGPLGCLP